MTDRLLPPVPDPRTARKRTPRSRAGAARGARTLPAMTVGRGAAESEPTLFGLPAEIVSDEDTAERSAVDASPAPPQSDGGLAVVRRADRFGAAALVLAGVAANVSLSLSWAPGESPTGLALVQAGVELLSADLGTPVPSGLWEPIVVVLGGGLLVVLGILLLVPARAHRLIGVLSLVVSLAAAVAVALLMADGGWGADQFGPGMWCAAAVPVLGTLGSLKAMLTAPLVVLDVES